MACLMCGSLTKRSSIGNLTCSKCGLIQVSRIPLLGGGIGSADRKLVEMNLLCAELGLQDAEEAKKIMRSAYVQISRGNYTNEELAVVSLYIYLRMNNRVANLKKMCDIMGVQVGRAKRVLARTEDYFNIDLKYNIEEARAFCEVNGYDVMDIVERVNEVMQITRPILAACVYMGSDLSYRKVAKLFYTSSKSVRNYTKKIEELI